MSPRQLNFLSAFSLSTAIAVVYHQAWGIAQPAIPAAPIEATTGTNVTIFQALILGLVQGLTEFLPISSTAHLKVVPVALGWGDPGVAFTAVIQLGSIAAVLWYFWEDLSTITQGVIKAVKTQNYNSFEFKLALGIGIGTLPIVFFGLLMKLFIKDLDLSLIHI